MQCLWAVAFINCLLFCLNSGGAKVVIPNAVPYFYDDKNHLIDACSNSCHHQRRIGHCFEVKMAALSVMVTKRPWTQRPNLLGFPPGPMTLGIFPASCSAMRRDSISTPSWVLRGKAHIKRIGCRCLAGIHFEDCYGEGIGWETLVTAASSAFCSTRRPSRVFVKPPGKGTGLNDCNMSRETGY